MNYNIQDLVNRLNGMAKSGHREKTKKRTMTNQFTFDQIVSINHGSVEDAERIISIYLSNGKLCRISNDDFDGYLSGSLSEKDLRLKSTLDRASEQSGKVYNILNLIGLVGGWLGLLITQVFRINLLDLLSN